MTDWKAFYHSIELTPEEIEEAIFEGKKKKYFREHNKDYWEEQEHGMPELRESKNRKQRPDVVRNVRGSDEKSGTNESTGTR